MLARWRRAISSNLGWRHEPGEDVAAAGGESWDLGVEVFVFDIAHAQKRPLLGVSYSF